MDIPELMHHLPENEGGHMFERMISLCSGRIFAWRSSKSVRSHQKGASCHGQWLQRSLICRCASKPNTASPFHTATAHHDTTFLISYWTSSIDITTDLLRHVPDEFTSLSRLHRVLMVFRVDSTSFRKRLIDPCAYYSSFLKLYYGCPQRAK